MEQLRAVDEVDVGVRAGEPGVPGREAEAPVAEGDLDVADEFDRVERLALGVDPIVERDEDPHVVAQRAQPPGQRGGDVGQPPGLGERGDLGRGEADL